MHTLPGPAPPRQRRCLPAPPRAPRARRSQAAPAREHARRMIGAVVRPCGLRTVRRRMVLMLKRCTSTLAGAGIWAIGLLPLAAGLACHVSEWRMRLLHSRRGITQQAQGPRLQRQRLRRPRRLRARERPRRRPRPPRLPKAPRSPSRQRTVLRSQAASRSVSYERKDAVRAVMLSGCPRARLMRMPHPRCWQLADGSALVGPDATRSALPDHVLPKC